ncbi:alanine--tRNA ligase [Buchnera aphidicola]|uniref:Alanine--tRNA ligase n=1 Tax=Buchnera aphidicola str. Ua (Uroleucon ambrosiae) TaxID=1005057 RepID=G2LPQ2_BUCUM|nr:alanine--tRNA ligase [Buchnera aphidicola]AEO08189.1 alanyl-tRNA synthetase [Buchnera aphidicola str. Ua (Uroleucon ambrosiae)]
MNITTNKIRQDFLNFFKEKKHMILPSSSLVPYNDSTLLFTNAGMNQFKEIFLGEKKIDYSRVATVQRCLRTGGKHNDLENVGYTSRHHTFFEMLGNFSFNDYFKKEAIEYAWELLTSKKWFNIPKHKLWISVYKEDDETYKIWKDIIKIPVKQIIKIGDNNNIQYNSDNFWQMGDSGPCGPCTEIFYDYENNIVNNPESFLENKNHRFVEIWNIVFIEFNRISKKKIVPLKHKSIDTGMGLERIAAILQNVFSNYNIDIFQQLKQHISQLSKVKDLNHTSLQVIADHIRSCTYIIADNITPSNEHRGYVLKRIIRRALRHCHKIGMKKQLFYKLVSTVIEVMGDSGKILKQKQKKIEEILKLEEIQFSYTLEKGLKILQHEIKKAHNNMLSGETAFYLYDTFGFPIDLTADICREKNIQIDLNAYELEKSKQKKQSNINQKFYKNYNNITINNTCVFEGYKKNKTKSLVKYIFINNQSVSIIKKNEYGIIFLDKTPFYPESGGQIGDIGELYNKKCYFLVENTKKYGNAIGHFGKLISGKIEIKKYINTKINQVNRNSIQLNHSATHLLHAVLRHILGEHVYQKGSLVTNKHLRFDFSYQTPIEISQIQDIEHMINMYIRHNILIKTQILSLEEAKKQKAIALFDNQYSSIVRVVSIKNISIELCGGTHTKRTGDIGLFKIISYSSIASGIKRIEAVTGQKAIDYLHQKDNYITDLSLILQCNNSDIKDKITNLKNKIKNIEDKIIQLQQKENTYYITKLLKNTYDIKGIKLLIHVFNQYEHKLLRIITDTLKQKLKKTITVLVNIINNRFTVIIGVTKNLLDHITAIQIMKMIVEKTHTKGGGKKEIAEGGGIYTEKLSIVLKNIPLWIDEQLDKK